MKRTISKFLRVGMAALLTVLLTGVMPVGVAAAKTDKTTTTTPGNNGTLKVHEQGSTVEDPSNEPKVCVFNFEGFEFDAGQSGYLVLTPQGGSDPVGEAAGPFAFGPTNASGEAQTGYFNDDDGPEIVNGTYKVTLYGKDAAGNVDYNNDLKAKSKVFKVDCAVEVPDQEVTPTAVAFDDQCGTENDTYTIPSTTGVTYKIDGTAVPAGTYAGSGEVTVTAEADAGYALADDADDSWTFMFTDESCETPPITVVPANVTFTPPTCENPAHGSYTIPTTTGVQYLVSLNGATATDVAAGTYQVATGSTVVVTAEAEAGYELDQYEPWEYTFELEEGCVLPDNDVCPNIVGSQETVPEGMVKDEDGNCVTPVVPVTPTTPTTPGRGGQVLTAATVVAVPTTSTAVLANTGEGSNPWVNLIVGLTLVALTLGTAVVVRPQEA